MSAALKLETPTSLDTLLRRSHTLLGGLVHGLEGHIVEIQARAVRKLGKIVRKEFDWRDVVSISGMAKDVTRESLDRITGAFLALSIPVTPVEILVNLTPPDLKKDGTWLDLPLAIILLQAAGFLPDLPDHMEADTVFMGEVGLHGELRRVPGALSIAMAAKAGQSLFVPSGNEREVALILAKPGHEGCKVFSFGLLEHVIGYFSGVRKLDEHKLVGKLKFTTAVNRSPDFGRIKGHQGAKDAALIAAAGGHNMLMMGPPGEGKSLLASAIPGILPRLTEEETVDLTKIYSAAGALENDGMVVNRRPFRVVQSTASKQALVGGGTGVPRPGAVTLAHFGVLFLDEFAEFSASVLDALRQPIEAGTTTVSKAGYSVTYPSRFTLVAAMNPCPCGYYPSKDCRCSKTIVTKYLNKISGPILDRIDLQVELKTLSFDERFSESSDSESTMMLGKVEAARLLQRNRFAGTSIPYNSAIPGGRVFEYCLFTENAMIVFKGLVAVNNMSTRSMDRLAKVARTIADLESSTDIETRHVEKAGTYLIGGLLRER